MKFSDYSALGSAARGDGWIPPDWGSSLTEADYANLRGSWITPKLAQQAMLRKIDAVEGREVIGQKGGRDSAGIGDLDPSLSPRVGIPGGRPEGTEG